MLCSPCYFSHTQGAKRHGPSFQTCAFSNLTQCTSLPPTSSPSQAGLMAPSVASKLPEPRASASSEKLLLTLTWFRLAWCLPPGVGGLFSLTPHKAWNLRRVQPPPRLPRPFLRHFSSLLIQDPATSPAVTPGDCLSTGLRVTEDLRFCCFLHACPLLDDPTDGHTPFWAPATLSCSPPAISANTLAPLPLPAAGDRAHAGGGREASSTPTPTRSCPRTPLAHPQLPSWPQCAPM